MWAQSEMWSSLMEGGREFSWGVNDVISCNEEEKWNLTLQKSLCSDRRVTEDLFDSFFYLFCQGLLWLCLSSKNPWSGFLQSICYLYSFTSFSFLPFLPPSSAVILPGCRFPFEPVYRTRSSPETAGDVTAPPETWQIDGESALWVRGGK